MVTYSFTIKGAPVCQQRARTVRKGGRTWTYDPSSKERKTLSLALLEARTRAGAGVFEGDLVLKATFYYTRGKRGARPDLSNLVKALEDSGNKILWVDDKQIVETQAKKIEVELGHQKTEVEIIEYA